ncbi:hypothetical protein K438DRAFT_1776449 [Mycena galopus ATCC 62051]|nr:hypothetical protein K438DRAFT_1776449 [Mycena galopus ATCC 62051]
MAWIIVSYAKQSEMRLVTVEVHDNEGANVKLKLRLQVFRRLWTRAFRCMYQFDETAQGWLNGRTRLGPIVIRKLAPKPPPSDPYADSTEGTFPGTRRPRSAGVVAHATPPNGIREAGPVKSEIGADANKPYHDGPYVEFGRLIHQSPPSICYANDVQAQAYNAPPKVHAPPYYLLAGVFRTSHQFRPEGVTGVVILAILEIESIEESHRTFRIRTDGDPYTYGTIRRPSGTRRRSVEESPKRSGPSRQSLKKFAEIRLDTDRITYTYGDSACTQDGSRRPSSWVIILVSRVWDPAYHLLQHFWGNNHFVPTAFSGPRLSAAIFAIFGSQALAHSAGYSSWMLTRTRRPGKKGADKASLVCCPELPALLSSLFLSRLWILASGYNNT